MSSKRRQEGTPRKHVPTNLALNDYSPVETLFCTTYTKNISKWPRNVYDTKWGSYLYIRKVCTYPLLIVGSHFSGQGGHSKELVKNLINLVVLFSGRFHKSTVRTLTVAVHLNFLCTDRSEIATQLFKNI